MRAEHGNESIYGGSYGWASAGRFHHAQSQLHRFLNCIGGYTASVNSYSLGASEVILPHVVGRRHEVLRRATTWKAILEHTELVVAFGGMNVKNAWVSPGGVTRHTLPAEPRRRRTAAAWHFELFSPLRSDLPRDVTGHVAPRGARHRHRRDARPWPTCSSPRGCTTRAFLDRYTVGADRLIAYVLGEEDGLPKTPEWAEAISGIAAATIRDLARRMAERRTLVTVSWGLQRTQHGEQPVWMGIALAALLGQIGLPGGGFGHGYGSMADVGAPTVPVPAAGVRPGPQPGRHLHPGRPDHPAAREPGRHARLRRAHVCGCPTSASSTGPAATRSTTTRTSTGCARAFARPDTVVVHESFWTAHRPPRRHRAADHDVARARRRGRRPQRRLRHRHAAGHRAGGRGPRRLRGLRRAGEAPRRLGRVHRRAHARASGSSTSTSGSDERVRRARCRRAAVRGVLGGGRGPPAGRSSDDHTLFDRFRDRPRRPQAADTRAAASSCSPTTIDALRLRRLPGPPCLARARGVAGRRAAERVPART